MTTVFLILPFSSRGFEFSIFPSTRQPFLYMILMIAYLSFRPVPFFYKHFPMSVNFFGGSNGNISFHCAGFLVDVFVSFWSSASCHCLVNFTSSAFPFQLPLFLHISSLFSETSDRRLWHPCHPLCGAQGPAH